MKNRRILSSLIAGLILSTSALAQQPPNTNNLQTTTFLPSGKTITLNTRQSVNDYYSITKQSGFSDQDSSYSVRGKCTVNRVSDLAYGNYAVTVGLYTTGALASGKDNGNERSKLIVTYYDYEKKEYVTKETTGLNLTLPPYKAGDPKTKTLTFEFEITDGCFKTTNRYYCPGMMLLISNAPYSEIPKFNYYLKCEYSCYGNSPKICGDINIPEIKNLKSVNGS